MSRGCQLFPLHARSVYFHVRVKSSMAKLDLSLTNMLSPRPIPCPLKEWCPWPPPSRIRTWIRQFGFKAAVSDPNGGKLTFFVHREFVEDPVPWNSYLKRRIFSVRGRSSVGIGRVTNARVGVRIRATVSQWLHSISRVTFHAREFVSLAMAACRTALTRWLMAATWRMLTGRSVPSGAGGG